MKSNLDQWAGALAATSKLLAEITLVSDLSSADKHRLKMMCIDIANTAEAFKNLLEKK